MRQRRTERINRMVGLNVILPLIRWILQLGILLPLGYSFWSAATGIFWYVRNKEEPELDGVLRAGHFLLWYGGDIWLCAVLMHFGTWLCYGYRSHTEAAALMLWSAPLYMAASLFHTAAATVTLWSGEPQKSNRVLILRNRILACYSFGLCFFLSAWLFA